MAHVEKRGANRWRARYRDPSGRERSKTFARKIDAEQWLATVAVSKLKGEWVDPRLGRLTFTDWIDRWSPTIVDLRASTLDRDLGLIRNHLIPRFGSAQLSRITTSSVRAWISEATSTGEHSPATVRKAGQVLAKVMAAAVDEGMISRSPCDQVHLPAEGERDMVFLDADQVHVLASSIDEHYRVLVIAAAYLGLRWGELAGLRTERVDLLRRQVLVVEQMTEVNGTLSVGPPKTAAGRRSVVVPKFLVPMLEEQLLERAEPKGLVFPSKTGGPMRRSNFARRSWQPACLSTGLGQWTNDAGDTWKANDGTKHYAGLRFHDLRHTAVALAIGAGAHPKSIQERMGHSSISVTLDRYGHLFPALDERIADGLDDAWSASLKKLPRPARGLVDASAPSVAVAEPG